MTCVVGIDIGTTSTIGILLDTKSNKIYTLPDTFHKTSSINGFRGMLGLKIAAI